MALLPDQKFSTFAVGNTLQVGDIVVGLRGGINTQFTWTIPAGITTLTGTANQVLVNGTSGSPVSGDVTLTTPQNIGTTSSPTFANLTIGNQIFGANGLPVFSVTSLTSAVNWLEVNNQVTGQNPGFIAFGSDTNVGIGFVTKNAGIFNFSTLSNTGVLFQTGTSYQHMTNFIFPNTNDTQNVTFQDASGTVAYLSNIPAGSPAALTANPDTNVTITLGGTPSTALLQATSITLGWTGQLALTRGGSNASLTASNGGIIYSTASAMAVLSGTATAQQLLLSGASTAPQWSTTTYPLTNAVNTIMYASSANVLGVITPVNSAVLISSSGGVPSMSTTLPSGLTIPGYQTTITPAALTSSNDTNVTITLGGTPATALLQATSLTMGWSGQLAVGRGGTGVSSVTIAPTATAFAGWDGNKNFSSNAFIGGFTSIASSATPITLTVSSTQTYYITGSTAQTVTMPVTSTLVAGMRWTIINASAATTTVNSSGANLIVSLPSNSQAILTCIVNSGTTATSWSTDYTLAVAGVSSITGTANQVIASSSTGAVTLSLPQSIGTGSTPTFAGVILPNSATAFAGLLVPTVQQFVSGSGTYTTPTSPAPLYIRVVMVGGGGGGAGSGTSPGSTTAGGNTTFGSSLLVANGGGAASGTPGTTSLGGTKGIGLQGSWGGTASSLSNGNGGNGGCSALGGGGYGGAASNGGHAAVSNTGSGGGGGGGGAATGSGAGGSSGGYVDAIITSLNLTYSYAVGGAGTGGTAGTGGNAGANGGSGSITVYEYYQ